MIGISAHYFVFIEHGFPSPSWHNSLFLSCAAFVGRVATMGGARGAGSPKGDTGVLPMVQSRLHRGPHSNMAPTDDHADDHADD